MYNELRNDDDLQSIIESETQESLHLDFKNSAALTRTDRSKTDISKDISSFANSDGGTIVYGLIEADHKASSLDEGTAEIDKEWLENVIMSTISPRIDGIIIHPIDRGGGKFAYIVHIPKSLKAPHQASDKRFYKRFNFKSVPMEQYEVLDVMNRIVAPLLRLEFELPSAPTLSFMQQRGVSQAIPLAIKIINESETPAEYATVRVYIHDSIETLASDKLYNLKNDVAVNIMNYDYDSTEITRRLKIPDTPPVWKGEDTYIADEPIYLKFPHTSYGESLFIKYEIKSPHMSDVVAYRGIHFNGHRVTKITDHDLFTEQEIATEISL